MNTRLFFVAAAAALLCLACRGQTARPSHPEPVYRQAPPAREPALQVGDDKQVELNFRSGW